MREDRPRNLKDMLTEAKNTSELMVDLAYAALFYNSEDISYKSLPARRTANGLVFDMRTLAIPPPPPRRLRAMPHPAGGAGYRKIARRLRLAKIVVKLGIPPNSPGPPRAEESPSACA